MTVANSPLKILYLVYWGAAEPLGQSLVLPAVKKLAESGVKLTLITFEKPADLLNEPLIKQICASLEKRDVQWIPLRYHKNPKIVFDLMQGIFTALKVAIQFRPDMLHARTFVGGLMGLFLAPLLRVKWIFHNEGFFPDEQVDGGVWQKDSRLHRAFKWLEQQMYARADGIIALSHRAKNIIQTLPPVVRKNTPVIVVPSCVELQHFQVHEAQSFSPHELKLIYVGSIGRRYLLDKIGSFAAVAAEEFAQIHLRVLSRMEKSLVGEMLASGGLTEQYWSYDCVTREDIPPELSQQQAGLFFLTNGLSEHGCSPTKIGEYWAAGLPVITTSNVSDTDEIIRREKVGVIIEGHNAEAYRRAIHELKDLLTDPQLPQRCRQAAEKYYALAPACEQQVQLYKNLILTCAVSKPISPISEEA